MEIYGFLLISNLLFLALNSFPVASGSAEYKCSSRSVPACNKHLTRKDFPSYFQFGAGSAAYQVEGAWNVSGKGPSIWDTFAHLHPEKIEDGSNADVATDSYHKYKEDVHAVKELNLDVYRFSISWARLLPHGKVSMGVNPDGVRYYNKLIDELLDYGIEPCVTLFHFDTPQALEDLYGGFLSYNIVEDFVNYADLAFSLFGDRVKLWTTINEPLSFSNLGYATGQLAPGRCSFWFDSSCAGGNAGTEPYTVTHHQLLAHAGAVRLYREKYKPKQNGSIGITLVSHWFVPFDEKHPDDAANVALAFEFGWFMDPIAFGDYPEIMKKRVQGRMPSFTEQQKKVLRDSFDFLGINYYTGQFAKKFPQGYKPPYPSYDTDGVNLTMTDVQGQYLGGGPVDHDVWVQLYPKGLRQLLKHIKDRYKNPPVYITENGMCTVESSSPMLSIMDTKRVKYINQHLCCLKNAIEDGANVRGIMFWSLLDNYEWMKGYTHRFGNYYIDFNSKDLKRTPKASARWLSGILSRDSHGSHNTTADSFDISVAEADHAKLFVDS